MICTKRPVSVPQVSKSKNQSKHAQLCARIICGWVTYTCESLRELRLDRVDVVVAVIFIDKMAHRKETPKQWSHQPVDTAECEIDVCF